MKAKIVMSEHLQLPVGHHLGHHPAFLLGGSDFSSSAGSSSGLVSEPFFLGDPTVLAYNR